MLESFHKSVEVFTAFSSVCQNHSFKPLEFLPLLFILFELVGSSLQHTGPHFLISYHPCFFLSFLYLFLCLPPARIPTAAWTRCVPPRHTRTHTSAQTHIYVHTHRHTHTHPYTRQRTQQEMPNTSFRMMPLCQLDREAAGSVTREGDEDQVRKWDRWRVVSCQNLPWKIDK